MPGAIVAFLPGCRNRTVSSYISPCAPREIMDDWPVLGGRGWHWWGEGVLVGGAELGFSYSLEWTWASSLPTVGCSSVLYHTVMAES